MSTVQKHKYFAATAYAMSITLLVSFGCLHREMGSGSGAFAEDAAFLKQHTDLVVLKNGVSAVAVAPAYQGRVMTSTFDAATGPSFGWINRPVIQ